MKVEGAVQIFKMNSAAEPTKDDQPQITLQDHRDSAPTGRDHNPALDQTKMVQTIQTTSREQKERHVSFLPKIKSAE